MRIKFLLAIGLNLVVGLTLAFGQASNNLHETLPANNSTFLSDLQTVLKKEDADRFAEMWTGFVVSGCTNGTGAGLTKTPASCTAYPGGFYVTETGSITYNDATANQWVVMDNVTTGNKGTFTRVSGTHYLLDTTSGGAKPTLCSNCAWLMQVTTAAGAVTVVTDLRSMTPAVQTYLFSELPAAGTRGRLAFARDTGTLYFDTGSAWTSVASALTTKGDLVVFTTTTVRKAVGADNLPLVADSSQADGLNYKVLPYQGGGTGLSAAPTNGQLDIGNGSGFTRATLTGGAGVTITNGAGSITVASTSAGSQVDNFRCTLTTGLPVTTSDVTAATTVYVTPTGGNQIGLFDGAATWNTRTSAEMSIAVPNTTSTMYDLFVYDNAGTPTLETLVWSNDTTRATALVLQNGVYVKSGATTRRYQCSFRTTGVAGQTEDSVAKRYVWNYYNRHLRQMKVVEATVSWNYTTATYRQANGAAANQLDCVIGLGEDAIKISAYSVATNGSAVVLSTGIGVNSTSANSAIINHNQTTGSGAGVYDLVSAHYNAIPSVGRNFYAWLEYSGAAGTTTWYGAGTTPLAQSGIIGEVWQ